jgi:hypothetical protein
MLRLGKVTLCNLYERRRSRNAILLLNPTEQVDNNRVFIEIEHNYFNSPCFMGKQLKMICFYDFKGGSQAGQILQLQRSIRHINRLSQVK